MSWSRWWNRQQQPGSVNWASWSPDPLPGVVRMSAWEACAHGAEAVCYFHWWQAPFAQEPCTQVCCALTASRPRRVKLHKLPPNRRKCQMFPLPAPMQRWGGLRLSLGMGHQPLGRDFSSFHLAFETCRASAVWV